MTDHTQRDYMHAVWHHLFSDTETLLVDRSSKLNPSGTRAFTRTIGDVRPLTLESIPSQPPAKSVTVVESIDLTWIKTLGEKWQIDPSFFAEYIVERVRSPVLWLDVFGSSPADQRRPSCYACSPWIASADAESKTLDTCWHVDGILSYGWSLAEKGDSHPANNVIPRRYAHDAMSGSNEITRISCYRRRDEAYLILIDAPRTKTESISPTRTKLHLPVANNRGGLIFPEMFDENRFSLWQCFRQFLSHSWHFDVLFPAHHHTGVHPSPETIFHLMIASTWKANLRILNSQIRHIAFHELRRPNILTNDHLHAHRENLVTLQTSVAEIPTWIPNIVRSDLEAMIARTAVNPTQQAYIGFPDDLLRETLAETAQVEKFLMDSFHLLLSSIGVLEAKASIEQARRAQRLTQLAFLYIPLSFVTGLFGMNVREFNGSAPPLWVFVCTLVVTVGATGFVFWGFAWWEKVFEERKER